MWLVLSSSPDPAAAWIAEAMRRRGLAPVELIPVELLLQARRWDHRVGTEGASVSVTLADGRELEGHEIRGVLNRILYIPPAATAVAIAEDREYALQELTAFFMSWLRALPPPVIGLPTPQGLSGSWRHISEWVHLAAAAGLPTAAYRQGSSWGNGAGPEQRLVPPGAELRTVITIGNRAFAPWAPPDLLEGCTRLARLAEADVLGVDFALANGRPSLAGASPVPDLRLGGEPAVDHLVALFRGEAA
jgi:hypothetical protein